MEPLLTALDKQFALLHAGSRELVAGLDDETLYRSPGTGPLSLRPFSCGELVARSAAEVERSFGGITTRLWDDPFEWTLPEHLSTVTSLLGYLDLVEATRQRGFGFFRSDADLSRTLPAPRLLKPIGEILIETLCRAAHFQGEAAAVNRIIHGEEDIAS